MLFDVCEFGNAKHLYFMHVFLFSGQGVVLALLHSMFAVIVLHPFIWNQQLTPLRVSQFLTPW